MSTFDRAAISGTGCNIWVGLNKTSNDAWFESLAYSLDSSVRHTSMNVVSSGLYVANLHHVISTLKIDLCLLFIEIFDYIHGLIY